MIRHVDETYWKQYYATHNDRRFDDLVNDFFTPDATFENPKTQTRGREQLIRFFKQSNQSVKIDLIPRSVIVSAGVTAVELDCVMHAEMDMPDFLLGPLKKGSAATMRMAGHRSFAERSTPQRPHRSRYHQAGRIGRIGIP